MGLALLSLTILLYAVIELMKFANILPRPIVCIGNVVDCQMVQQTMDSLPGHGKYISSVTFRSDPPTNLAGYTSSRGDMWISDNLDDVQKRTLLIHEYGHVVDFFHLTGKPQGTTSPFTVRYMPVFKDDPSVAFYSLSWNSTATRKDGSTSKDFVTEYARESAVEDFAETYAYFVVARDAFEQRAKENAVLREKLDSIKALFPLGFTVVDMEPWNGSVPLSTTDLSYEWQQPL
ncbi:MAG: hypothetical protein WCV62_03715 [Candidatus Peribacteraceae bacterium]|jgi:hypothetical protein